MRRKPIPQDIHAYPIASERALAEEREDLADELESLRTVVSEVVLFAASHHDQEEPHVLLHALQVDIPTMLQNALEIECPAFDPDTDEVEFRRKSRSRTGF